MAYMDNPGYQGQQLPPWMQQYQQQPYGVGQGQPWNDQGYSGTPLRGSDAEFWASRLYGGNLLHNLAQGGYLTGDPRMSPITEFLRQQAGQTSQALQRRYSTQAGMSGLPPELQAAMRFRAGLAGFGSEANTINQSLGSQYQGQQDFARQLAGGLLGYNAPTKYRGATDWSGILGGLAGGLGSALSRAPGIGGSRRTAGGGY